VEADYGIMFTVFKENFLFILEKTGAATFPFSCYSSGTSSEHLKDQAPIQPTPHTVHSCLMCRAGTL